MEIQKYDLVSNALGEYGMVLGKDEDNNIAVALISAQHSISDEDVLNEWRSKINTNWDVKGIILSPPCDLELERRYSQNDVFIIRGHGLCRVHTVRKGYVCFRMLDGNNSSNTLTFPIMRLNT